jgi:3-(3-hydroxy-phenyl)propionate hydroxylase
MFDGAMRPGAAAADAPVDDHGAASWLLRQLGQGFTLLVYGETVPAGLISKAVDVLLVVPKGSMVRDVGAARVVEDKEGWFVRRYDARPGSAWLLRPDQHVCARWRNPDATAVAGAYRRALGHSTKD